MAPTIFSQLQYWLQKTYTRSSTDSVKIFTSGFAGKVLRKWLLSTEVEAWNLTKNKLLKLVNSMKTDFLFVGLNLDTTVRGENARQMHILWMML